MKNLWLFGLEVVITYPLSAVGTISGTTTTSWGTPVVVESSCGGERRTCY